MTREDLIAAAEALEEMAEHLDGLHLLQSRDECLKKARELRAQAEAMPRIVREGRDFDVKFHDNGAATSRKDGTRSDGKSALESAAAAAPPSAAQPVAWTMSELCRFFAYAYRAGHDDTCEAVYTHVLECDADTYHQDSVVEYLTDNCMSAAPPDLAARVAELEAALRNLLNDTQHSEHHCGDEACPVSIARAVLAKETQ